MHNPTAKLSSAPSYPNFILNHKALGSGNATQGQVQQAQPQNLGQWLEDARAYYNNVMSGAVPQPSPQQWNQFMTWLNWATQQAGPAAGNWDPMGGGVGMGGAQMPQSTLPAGASPGVHGNAVIDREKAEVKYAPTGMPIDVLSDEFTLNVDRKIQGEVRVEKTTHPRLPDMEVIKIVVHNENVQPADTVYYVQPDAKISINTVGGKGVELGGLETLKDKDGKPQIAVGSYSAGNDTAAAGDDTSSVEGKLVDPNVKDNFEYTAASSGETINFTAASGGNETHNVYGNANISTEPGDSVSITRLPNSDGSYDIQVVVTHKDGKSTDTYVVDAGFNVQLNTNLERVTIDGVKYDGVVKYDGKTATAYGTKLVLTGPGNPTAAPAPAPAPSSGKYVSSAYLYSNKYAYISDLEP